MMRATRAGTGEWEVAALFEFVCKKEGAQELAYHTIISSDENHPYLHYYKHDRTLRDGDFLVVDAGPDLGYYDVDISISYPANGRFTPASARSTRRPWPWNRRVSRATGPA